MTFSDPLAGIADIPWPDLTHAYGPATDLPPLFPALLNAHHDRHEETWEEFWNLVMHQGTLYPATVAVIPLFIGWLDQPEVNVQGALWGFLTAAVTGNFQREEREDDFYTSYYGAAYGEIVQRVRQAVLAGLPKYIDMAQSQDETNRKAAYTLLAELPEAIPTTLPLLGERLQHEVSAELWGHLLKMHSRLLPHAAKKQQQDMISHCLELAHDPSVSLEWRVAALQTISLIDPAALPAETVPVFRKLVWDDPERFKSAGLGYWLHDLTQALEGRPDLLRAFLTELLAHATPGIRQRAVNDLHHHALEWRTQRTWAVQTLLHHLIGEQDVEVRVEVVKVLGQSGKAGQAAVSALLQEVNSPNTDVTFEAVVALSRLRLEVALPSLLRALETRELKKLARLCWVMRDVGDLPAELTPAVLNVMRRLREGEYDAEEQQESPFLDTPAEVMGGYVYLSRQLKEHDREVAHELTEIMRVVGDFQVLDPCAAQLAKRQVRNAVPVLLERLRHIPEDAPHTYAAIFDALAEVGDGRALEPLLAMWPLPLPEHFQWTVELPHLRAIASLGGQAALVWFRWMWLGDREQPAFLTRQPVSRTT